MTEYIMYVSSMFFAWLFVFLGRPAYAIFFILEYFAWLTHVQAKL